MNEILDVSRPELCGRAVIYTSVPEINRDNILKVINAALPAFKANSAQSDYLYNYYCGIQPILARTKKYNDHINNKVVVNRANEIVSFKTGYLMGEPIQYISRNEDEKVSDNIRKLNDDMFTEDKDAQDKELADWFSICGTSYRLVLPRENYRKDSGESSVRLFTLDPRQTFVVYSNGVNRRPMLGVITVQDENGDKISTCYTDRECYTIKNYTEILSIQGHLMRDVPIIEYPANKQRMGEFEVVIDLLDAINEMESDRLDGIDQFIQSLMVFKGVDVEDDAFTRAKELGGVCVPPDGDVKYIAEELNQSQAQVLADALYQEILTICGMPNRNGGSSTSDTGSAVLLRDGWSSAETKARNTESIFKSSEKKALKIMIRIMNTREGTDLNLADIEIRFTRRNYENIQAKSQVLLQMLSSPKIHPLLAFEHSGMFSDANLAYKMSMDNYAKVLEDEEKELREGITPDEKVEDEAEAQVAEEEE